VATSAPYILTRCWA